MGLILIVSGILVAFYTGAMLYYRILWEAKTEIQTTALREPLPRVSILIPARNEEKNLPGLLKSLINQSYPVNNMEIIVIDDHSADSTSGIAESFGFPVKLIKLSDYPNHENTNSYKKKAIETGINNSTGELIITTDADCIAPAGWVASVVSFYQAKSPTFIAAPVAINNPSSFIEIFQALDFLSLQGITGTGAHLMCNGANLAYTRKVFKDINGFTGIDSIASGDDMLLMQKIATQTPGGIQYLKSKAAIILTEPVSNISALFSQRRRWASKWGKYKDRTLLMILVPVFLLNIILFALPMLTIFKSEYVASGYSFNLIKVWLFMIAVKTFAELMFLYPVAKFYNMRKWLWIFPLLQPFHIIYTVIAGLLGITKTYRWKGRIVK